MSLPLFFKPWVGEHYLEGYGGVKILVLGASHYCTHRGCKHFDRCTSGKHGHPEYDYVCPDYKDKDIEGKRVSDITINEIRGFLESDDDYGTYRSYYRFTQWVVGHSVYTAGAPGEKMDLWEHIAFSNIYQYPLPQTYTPQGEIRRFKKIINAIIDDPILPDYPDVIIAWGSSVHDSLKTLGLEKAAERIYLWRDVDDKDIVVLLLMHPSARGFLTLDRELLDEAISLRKSLKYKKQ